MEAQEGPPVLECVSGFLQYVAAMFYVAQEVHLQPKVLAANRIFRALRNHFSNAAQVTSSILLTVDSLSVCRYDASSHFQQADPVLDRMSSTFQLQSSSGHDVDSRGRQGRGWDRRQVMPVLRSHKDSPCRRFCHAEQLNFCVLPWRDQTWPSEIHRNEGASHCQHQKSMLALTALICT